MPPLPADPGSIPGQEPLPGPIPGIPPVPPIGEPEPDRLPDEQPIPNPDENDAPPLSALIRHLSDASLPRWGLLCQGVGLYAQRGHRHHGSASLIKWEKLVGDERLELPTSSV